MAGEQRTIGPVAGVFLTVATVIDAGVFATLGPATDRRDQRTFTALPREPRVPEAREYESQIREAASEIIRETRWPIRNRAGRFAAGPCECSSKNCWTAPTVGDLALSRHH